MQFSHKASHISGAVLRDLPGRELQPGRGHLGRSTPLKHSTLKPKPGFSHWCANPSEAGGRAADASRSSPGWKLWLSSCSKGNIPRLKIAGVRWLLLQRLPTCLSLPQTRRERGRDGWTDGWRESRGKGTEEQARLCKAGCRAPALLVPASLPRGKCVCPKCDRTWPRNAQSSGSAMKQSTKGFALLAEELAGRDPATDHG